RAVRGNHLPRPRVGLRPAQMPRSAVPARRGRDGSFSIIAAMQTLQRTPLYERHVALGARLVPFAGWEMPVQYEGVIPEHRAVREDCGVFDVSHMGRFEFEGPKVPAA